MMAEPKTKAEKIQELVQQMKAGRLSKSELFSQLSQLQRKTKSVSVTSKEGTEEEEEEEEEHEDENHVVQGEVDKEKPTLSTSERRALIIQKLFEEKRRQRKRGSAADSPVAPNSMSVAVSPDRSTDQGFASSARVASHPSRSPHLILSPPSPPSARSPYSPRSLHSSRSVPSGRLGSNEKLASRETAQDTRLRRLQEELLTKQMEECTFKPKIRQLPEEYGIRRQHQEQLSFEDRIERWKQRRAEEADRKRREKEEEELGACTFKPKINKNARPVTPQPGRRNQGGDSTQTNDNAYERLYQMSKVNKLAELQAKARAEEEEELRRVCTFKPNIGKSEQYATRPRYHDSLNGRPSSAPRGRRPGTADMSSAASTASTTARRKMAWDEDLTFTPQTNPVHPKMEAAQLYLSKDIVSRLTQPRDSLYRQGANDENNDQNMRPGTPGRGEKVMDMTTFLSSSGGGLKRPSSAPKERNRGGSQQQQQPEGAKLSKEEAMERRRSFEAFLTRQSQQEKRKQQKIMQVAKQIEDPHKPKLCKKSVELASQRSKGTFLQRVAKGAMRKEQETVRLKSQSLDPECTFQPKINEVSKRKASRSVVEMSRGDSLKKETKARLMKLRLEQEELQSLTFSPELNSNKSVEGRLKILSEPDTYIRRLQHKNTLMSHKKNKVAQEQEMKELEECTFRPRIHDSPAYVKRIVRSLALAKPAKEAQAASSQPPRPDWR